MQQLYPTLLKYYSWCYPALAFLLMLRVLPPSPIPLVLFGLIALTELFLKKKVNGKLTKKDFGIVVAFVVVVVLLHLFLAFSRNFSH